MGQYIWRCKLTRQVANADEVQKTIANIVKDFGKIDTFVVNSGKHPGGYLSRNN